MREGAGIHPFIEDKAVAGKGESEDQRTESAVFKMEKDKEPLVGSKQALTP